ncbi:1,4-alpha-glucan branching protein GlgB [Soehngenia longivitae]|uniref:1,4-alpha-glucan branching enzyme GlgB n=1 Tax=Soehngenia longivitae TaxID=2562294 RepID=A0A4Z0D938_9FIRM|nr:1,4-alpha-glucan branching protein GlgB [Soehngenia longivitae]TFZ41418.1 1,4-alpha-glucan branching protein GlgB [Soehngenia longivitae]
MRDLKYHYPKEGELDAYLFHEGTFYKAYEFMGAHPYNKRYFHGYRFVVWAPRAREIYLTGDFNDWDETSLPMQRISNSGLWHIAVEGVEEYDKYKYRIITEQGEVRYKADPFAFHSDTRPFTDSKVFDIKGYKWNDRQWLKNRGKNLYNRPISIYEVHLLSWKQKEGGVVYSYRELAKELVNYVKKMGYTHIELLPITEHPLDASWGYQTTGYFAPTSRFGTPKDFMYFVDECHKNDIGVILDWVPAHFCKDDFGLARFDGTYLYESLDRAKAENEQWGTLNFDYTKPEVHSFLISNAIYWHDYYHIDGIRIDAVAYMLYLDFGGKDLKNIYGGRENLEAIEFIKKLNSSVFKYYPDTMMIAEESTAWPKVTYPVDEGGLGFNFKWNMGWMNDILKYMELDPLFRKDHHNALTFSMMYAFSENYILPLSHDEVVHGKKSLIDRMPGYYEDKFANLRLLYQYMYAHPGKKLLFMGGEFGQFIEWRFYESLEWHLLGYEKHQKLQKFVQDLNKLYKEESCLYDIDDSYEGFTWIEHENYLESIISFERINKKGERLIAIFNFTPVPRENYPIGVLEEGVYQTLFTSDHQRYGGNTKRVKSYRTKNEPFHGRDQSIRVDLPPLGGIYLKLREKTEE